MNGMNKLLKMKNMQIHFDKLITKLSKLFINC